MYFLILVVGALRIAQTNVNKKASGYLNSFGTMLHYGMYFEYASAAVALLCMLFTGFHGMESLLLICAMINGICFFADLITAMKAMQNAPIVLCTMCSMGGRLIPPCIIGIFLFDEPMSLIKWLGVAVFFLAAYLLSPKKSSKQQPMTWKTALLLAASFAVNGVCGIVIKYFATQSQYASAPLYAFFSYVSTAAIYTIAFVFHVRKHAPNGQTSVFRALRAAPLLPKPLYIYGSILGVIGTTITCCTTILGKTVPVVVLNSVPSAISIIGCLFTGYLFYKEQITWKNALGVVCGIASILLIV